mmetsp:Transcript_81866/g.236646  ORF Transcript_81866/g.236646 Transcript_81866/m.236646 type:complete len:797 (+) Transcript_81866:153-2543(+)
MVVSPARAAQAAGPGSRSHDSGFEEALQEVEREIFGSTPVGGPSIVLAPSDVSVRINVPPAPNRTPARIVAQEIADGVVGVLDERFAPVVKGLRGRMHDYAGRVEWARRAYEKWELDRREMEDKVEDLRAETAGLRERVASAAAESSGHLRMKGGVVTVGTGAILGARRSPQAAAFEIPLELEFEGAEHGALDGLDADARQSRCARWRQHMIRFARRLVPLARDIRFVNSRFGRTCGGYFKFQRFLWYLSCLVALFHVPVLVAHMMPHAGDAELDAYGHRRDGWEMCPTPLFSVPCRMLYGALFRRDGVRRDSTFAIKYLGAIVGSAGLLMTSGLLRWTTLDLRVQAEGLDDELHPRRWSTIVLQAWDFRLTSAEDRQNWGSSFETQLRAICAEEERLKWEQSHTRSQRYLLFARRAIGILLNLALIASAWVAVALSTRHREAISHELAVVLGHFGLGSFGAQIGALAPNLVVSAVGGVLPVVTKLLTTMEAWAPATRARHNVWRLYFGKILNLVFVVALNIELIAGTPLYGSTQALVARDFTKYPCAEDQSGAEMVSLVATELIFGLALRPLSNFGGAWLLHKFHLYGPQFQKPEFEIPDSAVNLVYFQLLLLTTAILAPPLAVATPFVLFFHFKWSLFSLVNLSSRPFVSESSALAATLLQLQCFTSFVYCGLAYTLAATPLPHAPLCGPLEAGEAPALLIATLGIPGVAAVSSAVTWVHSNPGVALGVMSVAAAVALLRTRSSLRAHRRAIDRLRAATGRDVEALRGELARMQRHSDLLRRRLEWHEKNKASV